MIKESQAIKHEKLSVSPPIIFDSNSRPNDRYGENFDVHSEKCHLAKPSTYWVGGRYRLSIIARLAHLGLFTY
jgi:hypothetical protein